MLWILAHQGGWDEFLMFAVPVGLGWWAIKAAERRSRERAEAQVTEAAADDAPAEESEGGTALQGQ